MSVRNFQGIIYPTWINFNPRMDMQFNHYKELDQIAYPFPNFNGCISQT